MTVFFGLACCFIANGMSPSARAINAEIRKIEKKHISDGEKADLVKAFINNQLKKIKAASGKTKDQIKDAILVEVEGANAAAIQEIKDAIQGLKSTPPAPPDPAIAARAELKNAIAKAQTDLLKIASDITAPLKQANGPLSKAGGTKLLTALEKNPAYNDAKKALLDVLIDKSEAAGKKLLKLEAGKKKTKEIEKVDLSTWINGLDKAGAEAAKADVEQLAANGQGAIEAAANKVAAEAYKAAVKKLKESAEAKRDAFDGRVTTAKAKAGDPKYTAVQAHEDAWDAALLAVNNAIGALPVLIPASSKKECKDAFDDARALTIKNGVLDKLEDACKDIEGDVKAVGAPKGGAKVEIEFLFGDTLGAGSPDADKLKVEIDPKQHAVAWTAIWSKLKEADGVIEKGAFDEDQLKANIKAGTKFDPIPGVSATIDINWGTISPADKTEILKQIK